MLHKELLRKLQGQLKKHREIGSRHGAGHWAGCSRGPADDTYKDRRPQDTRTVGIAPRARVAVRCEHKVRKQRQGQPPTAEPGLVGTQELP